MISAIDQINCTTLTILEIKHAKYLVLHDHKLDRQIYSQQLSNMET